MTAQDWVYFFLGVSALSLLWPFSSRARSSARIMGTPEMQKMRRSHEARRGGFLKRQYRDRGSRLLGLLLCFPHSLMRRQNTRAEAKPTWCCRICRRVNFLGMNGHALLMIGLLFCVGGLLFGLAIYVQLKNLPVHRTMREISELIYETCKTYLVTQGKFILLLWAFIAVIIALYFGYLAPVPGKSIAVTLPIILLFSAWSASRAATGWRGSEFA